MSKSARKSIQKSPTLKSPGQQWPQRAGYITIAMDNSFAYADMGRRLVRIHVEKQGNDDWRLLLRPVSGGRLVAKETKDGVTLQLLEDKK